MSDELHAVVRLLIARIESNPEEFKKNGNRWHSIIAGVLDSCSEEEEREIILALRPIRLKELHEEMMDELFNGEDRRRGQGAAFAQQQYANLNKLSTNSGIPINQQLGNQSVQLDEEIFAKLKKAAGLCLD